MTSDKITLCMLIFDIGVELIIFNVLTDNALVCVLLTFETIRLIGGLNLWSSVLSDTLLPYIH